MPIQARIMGTGNSQPSAQAIVGDTLVGQTALGSSQATAFALSAANTAFSTAAASTGAILPAFAASGDAFFVYNGGANTVTVYPPVGGTINNLSANTGLALATLKSGWYVCTAALTFVSVLSA